MDEFRRAGGATTAWPPNATEALKTADRRGFIAVLIRVSSASAKTLVTLVIAAHPAEPETLARRAVKQARADEAENDTWLAMLAVMLIR